MRSLLTEIIPERLGPTTTDFPDAQYQNEAAGILPTPLIQQLMSNYHYSILKQLHEAGITINNQTDNITDNQAWDAFLVNTKKLIEKNIPGLSALAPKIESGATRVDSIMPDFIRADGAALAFDILAATTNLKLSINNTPFVVDADINTTGITAAPSANNTAQIDDINMSNDLYAGEDDTVITIDVAGSEITSRIGQIAAFRTGTGEIFQAYIKSATELVSAYRGFYFDDNGDPIVRGNLSDNDTITLMLIGWVFIENDGATVDVAYTTPTTSYSAPSAPATNDYWYDITNQAWKKWSGSTWEISNNLLVGQIISDDTNTIASRCSDLTLPFDSTNTIEVEIDTTSVVNSKNISNKINIYGKAVIIADQKIFWDISTDMESGYGESSSTVYYLYISNNGNTIISPLKPYERLDLSGFYHPYETYRCIGMVYNNAASDFSIVDETSFNPCVKHKKCYIKDVKPSGTDGQFFALGWNILDLNTKSGDGDFASLATNQVTVLPGWYKLQIDATNYVDTTTTPAYARTALYDVSSGLYSDEILSNSVLHRVASGLNSTVHMVAKGIIKLTKPLIFEVGQNVSILGRTGAAASVVGLDEIYTQVEIIKIR